MFNKEQAPTVENNNFYVYVLIRKDIPLEHQITQACHAALEIGYDHSRPETPTYLITLSVANELALRKIETKLARLRIKTHLFWEPDPLMTNPDKPMGHTALATEPLSGSIREIFSDFQLWTAQHHEFIGTMPQRVGAR